MTDFGAPIMNFSVSSGLINMARRMGIATGFEYVLVCLLNIDYKLAKAKRSAWVSEHRVNALVQTLLPKAQDFEKLGQEGVCLQTVSMDPFSAGI